MKLKKGLLNGIITKAPDSETYDFLVSDGKIDRDQEVVDIAGMDIRHFNKKPVIMWAHRHDIPAIARAKGAVKKDGQLIIKGIRFAKKDISPLADEIHGLVDDDIIDSMSIGFSSLESKVPEGRTGKNDPWRTITKSELYEASFVNVGSNRGTEQLKSVDTYEADFKASGKSIADAEKEMFPDAEEKDMDTEDSIKYLVREFKRFGRDIEDIKSVIDMMYSDKGNEDNTEGTKSNIAKILDGDSEEGSHQPATSEEKTGRVAFRKSSINKEGGEAKKMPFLRNDNNNGGK